MRDALRATGLRALGRAIPRGRALGPLGVRAVRGEAELRGARAFAGRDLEHIAIAVAVVADHVVDERRDDLDVRDVAPRPVLGGEREAALDERLAERARAHAVAGEFLAG